jgi:hypothetical protein
VPEKQVDPRLQTGNQLVAPIVEIVDRATTNIQIYNMIENVKFAEDPRREPHEKETAIHIMGDGEEFTISSYKSVVYANVIQRKESEIDWITIREDGSEDTVYDLDEAIDREATIIGAGASLPVGALTIGEPRNNNSHSRIVK